MRAEHDLTEVLNDDPSPFPVFYVGLIGCLITLVVIILLAALFNQTERRELQTKLYDTPTATTDLRRILVQQQADLDVYRWIDKDKGVVGIPIGQAMKAVAADIAAGRPLAAAAASAPQSAPSGAAP